MPVEVPPVSVSIVAPAAVPAGARYAAVVVLDVPAGWHVYWENPGQSGLATDVSLAGAVGPSWPAPSRFTADGLVNYGYTGPTGFVFEATGPGPLEARAAWLLCREICVKGDGAARVVVAEGAAADPTGPWRDKVPRPFAESGGAVTVGERLSVRLPGPGPFAVFPTVALEGAWTPTVREEGGALLLEAALARPLPPDARLVLTRGDGRAYTLTLEPSP